MNHKLIHWLTHYDTNFSSTVGATGSQACGEGVRLDTFLGVKQSSVKQEAHGL
jgi:hypothetical protein